MDNIILIGTAAAACTTISFLPQVYKIYKTKHTKDLSLAMYIILAMGTFLWMIYGILMKSQPIIFANLITFISCLYVLAVMFKHK